MPAHSLLALFEPLVALPDDLRGVLEGRLHDTPSNAFVLLSLLRDAPAGLVLGRCRPRDRMVHAERLIVWRSKGGAIERDDLQYHEVRHAVIAANVLLRYYELPYGLGACWRGGVVRIGLVDRRQSKRSSLAVPVG